MKITIHTIDRKKYNHVIDEDHWLQIQKEMMDDDVKILIVCETYKDFHYNKLYIVAIEVFNED